MEPTNKGDEEANCGKPESSHVRPGEATCSNPTCLVVLIKGHGCAETALEAGRHGAMYRL